MKSPVQILDPVEMSAKEPPAKEPSAKEPPEQEPQADGINPILLEFLDADTLEEKMHIMTFYRNQMDEALLNSIAISLDLVVDKKGLQETYDEIMNCLSMMKHFECTNRFRRNRENKKKRSIKEKKNGRKVMQQHRLHQRKLCRMSKCKRCTETAEHAGTGESEVTYS